MRLGVLDVGSNTVHLLVVDAYQGARPIPAFSHKTELTLAAQLENGNSLSGPGESRLRGVVEEALRIAEDKGVEDIIAFATSAVREAVNGEQVLARIREKTGAQINVMTGQEEARLTFLAARRWFGWSSGRLLVIDIGGGSLEVASGIDEEPDAVASLPLGAGRLSRDWISTDPPSSQEVRAACASTCGPRSPGKWAACSGRAPRTRWSAPRRRSGSWPGSPGRRRPATARTSSASCGTPTWRPWPSACRR